MLRNAARKLEIILEFENYEGIFEDFRSKLDYFEI